VVSIKQYISGIYGKMMEYGLMALILIPPLIFLKTLHPELIKSVCIEVIVAGLFLVWLCMSIERRYLSYPSNPLNLSNPPNPPIRKTPMDIPLLLFLLAAALSTVFSRYPKLSLISLLQLSSYILIFFLVVNFADDKKKRDNMLKAMMILAFITCIYSFMIYAGFDWTVTWRENRLASTFANSNFFAAFLIMALPVAFHLYFRKQKTVRSSIYLIYLLIIALILNNLLCTFSRSAWIGCIISLFFIAVADHRHIWTQRSKLAMMIILLASFSALVFAKNVNLCPLYPSSSGATSEAIMAKAEQSFTYGNDSSYRYYTPTMKDFEYYQIKDLAGEMGLNESVPYLSIHLDPARKLHYITALDIFSDNLVSGTGIGTYGFMLPDYVPSKTPLNIYYSPETVHTHNEFLQIMAEMGLPGLITFLWVMLVFFYASFSMMISLGKKAGKKENGYSEKRSLIIALVAGIIALLIQNIFTVSMRYPSVTIFFWVFLGMVFASEDSARERAKKLKNKPDQKKWLRVLLVSAIILGLAFFVYAGSRVLLSDLYTSYPVNEYGLRKAIALNPYNMDPYLSLAVKAKQDGRPDIVIESMKMLNRTFPDYFAVNYVLGLTYCQTGDYVNAISELNKVKNKRLVEKWLIFAAYRKQNNIPPEQAINATIYING